jgi:hypothetical protein
MEGKVAMTIEKAELDQIQSNYKAAVDEWVTAIRLEEALASSNHSVAQIDQWEGAANREEEARNKAKAVKQAYESALRQEFFNF